MGFVCLSSVIPILLTMLKKKVTLHELETSIIILNKTRPIVATMTG